ncbi:MAG: hypothetical protein JXA13_04400 [Anaerolineales bacterium]|nr:hypothetical protein [Anaerolineales bacterium]
MSATTSRVLAVLLATTFLMAACLPGQTAGDVQSQINTAVAQTIQAQDQMATFVAQTVEVQLAQATPDESGDTTADGTGTPTETPTETPIVTLTPILPTVTPFDTPASGGGGGVSTTPKYACDPDIGKRPFDNSVIRPGESFDIKFTIKNMGTETWPAGTDIIYFSGPNMAPTFPAVLEIPVDLGPGDTFSVGPYDATAPMDKGFQVMTFKVQGVYCYPYIAINVQDNR